MDGPGIQLAEGHLQQHAVEGRDQIHVLQAVRQGLSAEETITSITLWLKIGLIGYDWFLF